MFTGILSFFAVIAILLYVFPNQYKLIFAMVFLIFTLAIFVFFCAVILFFLGFLGIKDANWPLICIPAAIATLIFCYSVFRDSAKSEES